MNPTAADKNKEESLFTAWEKDGTGAERLAAFYFEKAWFAEAATFFRAAGKISSENQVKLAEALLNTGLYQEAFGILEKLDPKKFPRAAFLTGRADLEAGNAEKAVKTLKTCLKGNPENPETRIELGLALEAVGKEDEADAIFAEVRISDPGYFDVLFQEANTLFGLKLFRLAREKLKRAEKIVPRDAAIFYRLGLCYMDLNMAKEAEAAFKNAIRWRPTVEAYRELATVYEKSNQIEKAIVFCQAPLSGNPDNPYLKAVVAKCLLRKGEAEEALKTIEPVKEAFEEPEVRAEALTTLGRIYDKLGTFEQAFKAFVAAKQATRETGEFKKLDLEYPFRNTRAYRRLLEKGLPPLPQEKRTGERPKTHVFYTGFPRSGTTLVQTILDSHKSVATIDEKPVLRAVIRQLEEFAAGYPRAVGALTPDQAATLREVYFFQAKNFVDFDDKTTLVDKMPLSTLHLPLIRSLFPEAKILFSLRHPFAAAFSCLQQNFTLNNAMGNLTDLSGIARFYDLVMGFWKTMSQVPGFEYHLIRYEQLVGDPEGEIRAMCKFLDVKFSKAMLDYTKRAREKGVISTPSYSQVVQPIYTGALDNWKNYRDFFGSEAKTLETWCRYFGYPVD